MNEVNVLLADREDFKFVAIVFAPYTGTNTYSYKTFLDLTEDDYVVVETPTNGFQVVKVVKVLTPLEINFEVSYNYKWVVAKLDLTAYDEAVELEKEVLSVVNKSKNKRAMADAREAILDGVDVDVKKLVRL